VADMVMTYEATRDLERCWRQLPDSGRELVCNVDHLKQLVREVCAALLMCVLPVALQQAFCNCNRILQVLSFDIRPLHRRLGSQSSEAEACHCVNLMGIELTYIVSSKNRRRSVLLTSARQIVD
jgi:hypothetical protein